MPHVDNKERVGRLNPLSNLYKSWMLLSPKSHFMIFLGILWIMAGIGVINDAYLRVPNTFHSQIDFHIRSFLWIMPGCLSILSAIYRKWKQGALYLLCIMPTIRTASYLGAWIVAMVPGPPPGWDEGIWQAGFQTIPLVAVFAVMRLPITAKKTPESVSRVIDNITNRANGGEG